MAKPEVPQINGDEMDAFSKWGRRYLCWCHRAGIVKRIKRSYHKRVRQHEKQLVNTP